MHGSQRRTGLRQHVAVFIQVYQSLKHRRGRDVADGIEKAVHLKVLFFTSLIVFYVNSIK